MTCPDRHYPTDTAQWLKTAELQRQFPPPPNHSQPVPVLQWAQHVSQATRAAVDAGPQPTEQLARLYAVAADLADSILLKRLLPSRQHLIGASSLNFAEDLYQHIAGAYVIDVPVALIDCPRPDPVCRDTKQWCDWTTGLCAWLEDRAQAYHNALGIIARRMHLPLHTDVQILFNTYTAAVAVAASSCRWATAVQPAPA